VAWSWSRCSRRAPGPAPQMLQVSPYRAAHSSYGISASTSRCDGRRFGCLRPQSQRSLLPFHRVRHLGHVHISELQRLPRRLPSQPVIQMPQDDPQRAHFAGIDGRTVPPHPSCTNTNGSLAGMAVTVSRRLSLNTNGRLQRRHHHRVRPVWLVSAISEKTSQASATLGGGGVGAPRTPRDRAGCSTGT
jgi:hypothetical protein